MHSGKRQLRYTIIIFNHLEKVGGGSTTHAAVLDLDLVGEVLHLLDGRVQVLGGEGGGQVGRVGGDHDQGEEVPHP